MFLEAQTRPDDPGRKRTEASFRENLEAMLHLARRQRIPVLLCTVASNLKDCAPFASLHARQFDAAHRRAWEARVQAGAEFEQAQDWNAALQQYEQAAALDADYAELQFRMGRCHLALDQPAAARRCFERARDFDALPFRTTSTQNEIIRQCAAKFGGDPVVLLDVARELTAPDSTPIPGADLFYEHVHFNFTGNQRLARLIAAAATQLLESRQGITASGDPLTAEQADERLAVTPWDRYRVYQNVWQREQRPPFTQQLNHTNQLASLTQALQQFRSRMNSNTLPTALNRYRTALQARPEDFFLRGNLAKLLEDTGDLSGAAAEWARVSDLLPHHFGPAFYWGKVLARQGRTDAAARELTRALQIRPDLPEARAELSRVLLQQKRPAEALAQIRQAVAGQPDNARLYLDLAEAQAALEQRDAAIASLRRAIELRPDFWEARYLLGVELAVRNDLTGASEQFGAVLRWQPDHPLAHLNLGIALAKLGRIPEAMEQFQQTLRLSPSNQTAASYLNQLRAR